jgi:ribosome recycling factor
LALTTPRLAASSSPVPTVFPLRAPWVCPTGAVRPFSQTNACQKRKDKDSKNNKGKNLGDKSETADSSAGGALANFDPFDLQDIIDAFNRVEEHFMSELRKIRHSGGGKFTADAIGAIPVQPDKKNPQTFPLRELATIAPVGGGSAGGGAGARKWSILAFEESSIKPIMSAVQRAEGFNQQPQRNPENPLELVMTVEPETKEATAARAVKTCTAWRDRVRNEAHKRIDIHKKLFAQGKLVKDDAKRLNDKVQKLQDERMKVIKTREKEVTDAIMAR